MVHSKKNKKRQCEDDECSVSPTFNFEGDQPGVFCGRHKLEGMVNLRNKRCEYDGCSKWPQFNFHGQHRRRFCEEHKIQGMVNVKTHKRSAHTGGCSKCFFVGFGEKEGILDGVGHGQEKSPQPAPEATQENQQNRYYYHVRFGAADLIKLRTFLVREKGWKYTAGDMLDNTWFYLKPGTKKTDGVHGIDLFKGERELMAHVKENNSELRTEFKAWVKAGMPNSQKRKRKQTTAVVVIGETQVAKYFPPFGLFTGKIVSYEKPYYKVEYEDGDQEEYTHKEIVALMRQEKKQRAAQEKRAPLAVARAENNAADDWRTDDAPPPNTTPAASAPPRQMERLAAGKEAPRLRERLAAAEEAPRLGERLAAAEEAPRLRERLATAEEAPRLRERLATAEEAPRLRERLAAAEEAPRLRERLAAAEEAPRLRERLAAAEKALAGERRRRAQAEAREAEQRARADALEQLWARARAGAAAAAAAPQRRRRQERGGASGGGGGGSGGGPGVGRREGKRRWGR